MTAVPALPATSLVGNATVIEEAVLNALTGTLERHRLPDPRQQRHARPGDHPRPPNVP